MNNVKLHTVDDQYRHPPEATCWDFYRFRASLGWRGKIGGIYYQRCIEYPWSFNHLGLEPGQTVLDVGSERSPFPVFCAANVRNLTVYTVDRDADPFLKVQSGYIRSAQSRLATQNSTVKVSVQDLLELDFPDAYFDRISCISVIEHLPDDGDIEALRVLERILKPGGRLVLTTDMAEHHTETYRRADVYDRTYEGRPVFYARSYDYASLNRRLLTSSRLSVDTLTYVFEPSVPFSVLTTRAGLKPLLLPLRILNPLLASMWLKMVEAARSPDDRRLKNCRLACMVLTKPSDTENTEGRG